MSAEDFIFKVGGDTVYTPLEVTSAGETIVITNYGPDSLTDLGIFLRAASDTGDYEHPSDYPPETDYQDLLTWGTRTDEALEVSGGVIVTSELNDASTPVSYVTRTVGSTEANKIPLRDLASGESATIVVEIELPPATAARRFYVDLVVE